MPETWNTLKSFLSDITRDNLNQFICCTHCGSRHNYVKWGFYPRYLFDDSLIHIQRYRCDNDLCPIKTFSILPHAFLPVIRISLCMLIYILKLYEQEESIAAIARHTDSSWSRIQRLIFKAFAIRKWLRKEYENIFFCRAYRNRWFSFTRDFSWAFYPKKRW